MSSDKKTSELSIAVNGEAFPRRRFLRDMVRIGVVAGGLLGAKEGVEEAHTPSVPADSGEGEPSTLAKVAGGAKIVAGSIAMGAAVGATALGAIGLIGAVGTTAEPQKGDKGHER